MKNLFLRGERLTAPEVETPTPEQINLALQRVVTDEDGRQTLDGYYFPPDNQEPFYPRTLTTHYVNTGEEVEFESRFPNKSARRANLELAALGRGPLFIREDDPEHLRKMNEWQIRDRNYKGPITKLVYKALGWN
jgi:hypothetical protein